MSPLSAELYAVLGPVRYISEMPADTDMGLWTHPPLESRIKESQAPIPANAWYVNGSIKGNPPCWTAVSYSLVQTLYGWMEEDSKAVNGQNCEQLG